MGQYGKHEVIGVICVGQDLETLFADADQTAAKVRAAPTPPRRLSRGAARRASVSCRVAATLVHCQPLTRRAKNTQRTDSGGPYGAGGGADLRGQEYGRCGALHGGPGVVGEGEGQTAAEAVGGQARKAAAVPREHGGAEALPPPGGLGKRGRRYPTVTARHGMRDRGR